MTVGELIELLEKYPKDKKVKLDIGDDVYIYSYVGYIRISGSEYSGFGFG